MNNEARQVLLEDAQGLANTVTGDAPRDGEESPGEPMHERPIDSGPDRIRHGRRLPSAASRLGLAA